MSHCYHVQFMFGMAMMFAALPAAHAGMITVDLISTASTSTEATGVSGRLTFDFMENTEGDFLSLVIENTTNSLIGSRLTAVGFELPGLLTVAPVFAPGGASAYFDELDYDVDVSPGWLNAPGGYDLMVTSDHNFQGGNAQGAPQAGASQSILIALGNTAYNAPQLRDAFMDALSDGDQSFVVGRFQSVGPDGEDSDMVRGGRVVPEPATAALLIAGLLLPLARRQRARQSV